MIADASQTGRAIPIAVHISFSLFMAIIGMNTPFFLVKSVSNPGNPFMNRTIFALLASGLMGSALAQSTPPAAPQQPQAAPAPTVSVPGAKGATTQSLGEMTPFYVVGGAAVLGAIVVAASSGGSDHHTNTPPPTGTTGTH